MTAEALPDRIEQAIEYATGDAQWLLDTVHNDTISAVAHQVLRDAEVNRRHLPVHRSCEPPCPSLLDLAARYGVTS